jgi:hypothetical protein
MFSSLRCWLWIGSLALLMPTSPAAAPENPGLRFYEGKIDGRLAFRMVLPEPPKMAFECQGSYIYAGKRKVIALFGECSTTRLLLSETNGAGSASKQPKYNQIMADANDGGFLGTWQSADGRRSLSFEARELRPDRRTVLASAVGTYPLSGISGFFGANTMSETWRSGKGWQANLSGIHAGVREGQFVPLGRESIKVLNSLEVRVNADLTVEILGLGRVLALFPYSEYPSFLIQRMSLDDSSHRILGRNTRASFENKELRIATTDAVETELFASFENMPWDTSEPLALGLDYNPMERRFTLHLLPAGCCESVVLSFQPER